MDIAYWQLWLLSILAGTGVRIGWSLIGAAFYYVMHWIGACDCEEHG